MKRTNLLLISFLLLAASSQTGCVPALAGAMVKTIALSGYSTFEELKDQIPPIPAEKSRLIVYYPFDAAAVVLGPEKSWFWIDDMGTEVKSFFKMVPFQMMMRDKQFMFVDLTPGTHTVSCKWGLLFPKKITSVETIAGKTSYVKLQLHLSPIIIPEDKALKAIQKLKYYSKDPPQSFKLVAKK